MGVFNNGMSTFYGGGFLPNNNSKSLFLTTSQIIKYYSNASRPCPIDRDSPKSVSIAITAPKPTPLTKY